MVESSTTADLAPRERAEFWSEHVTAYQCRLGYRFSREGDFRGGTVRQRSGTYQLVEFWSEEVAYLRTPRQVREDPDEDYRLLIPLAGELVVRQDDVEARLAPGLGGLLPLGTPGELLHGSHARGYIMTIPSHEVNGRLDRSFPQTAAFDLTKGLGRVVRDMTSGLFDAREDLGRVQFDAVCDRVVELLCMLIVGDDRPHSSGHLAEVEARVRRYARAHAADPGLTGAAMARDLGWSLRQVQLALQQVGTTPRELIREERLRLVRDRLRDPACRHRTISDLALSSGFSSASVLSTAFRRRFGMSPREMRHDAGR